MPCYFLSRAKFKGYELAPSEISRLWNVVKTDVSALSYDVASFPMPSMRVFYDVTVKDFLKLYAAHRTTGDVAEKEMEEYGMRPDLGGFLGFTHAHFVKPTKVFTLVLIFVRKVSAPESIGRIISHEMAQLFELYLELKCGTLVKRLGLDRL